MSGEEKKVDLDALAKSVEALAGTVTGLHGNMQTIANSHKELLDAMKAKSDNDDDGREGKEDDMDINLETASRTDFAKYLLGEVQKVVEGAVTPIKEKTDEVDTKVTKGSLKAMIEELKAGPHPDIEEWGAELKDIMKESPGLSLKRAMRLAKEENPKKAKELGEKLADEKKKADEEAVAAKKAERKNFGGLTPSGSTTKSENTRMSQTEASEAAWEEVESQLDDTSILQSS